MPKVLSQPQYTAAKGYNGFPLRTSLQFSSPIGMLLPVWFHYLQPGDKVNCSTLLKTRTQPLASPAMVKINEHIDWFFVPMQQLYKLFEQVFYGVDDIHSGMFTSSQVSDVYPFTQLNDFVQMFTQLYEYSNGQTVAKLDIFNNSLAANAFRLMEHLGYDAESLVDAVYRYGWRSDVSTPYLNVSRSLWSALAYQRIYYSHYRLSDRENNNVTAYNVDYHYDSPHVAWADLKDIFCIHYRPIQKDFFHGGYVSPLIGRSNIGMLTSFNSGSSTFNSSFFREYLSPTGSMSTDPSGVSSTVSPASVRNSVNSNGSASYQDLNALRQSFALEKLLEITRRSGKHIDAQTLAHFGVKVPEGIADEAYFIGKHDSEIVIGDVIATADTVNSGNGAPLGQLAGKGYNHSQNRDVSGFEAKTHGVLMAVYSSDTSLHYEPCAVDKLNTYFSPQVFYKPEFDDLGMEPIFVYQGNERFIQPDAQTRTNIYNNNAFPDWVYRYWELKLKYNRTIGSVAGDMDMWTIKRPGYYEFGDPNNPTPQSILSQYLVDPRLIDDIMLMNFYSYLPATLTPDATDPNVYAFNFGNSWRSYIFSQDPLIHDLYIDVELASKMSTFGLPSL